MLPRENITLAPATAENAELAAEITWDTGYHNFGYQYEGKENFCKLATFLWQQETAFWSYKWATGAFVDGKLIGLELGWDTAQLDEEAEPFDAQLVEALGPELAARSGEKWKHLRFLMPTLPDDAYYISNLGLVPEMRGQRIGDMLLANAFTTAKAAGYREVHLDVASTKPAVGFYKRMGMEAAALTHMPPIEEHVPAHYRMVMDLSLWNS